MEESENEVAAVLPQTSVRCPSAASARRRAAPRFARIPAVRSDRTELAPGCSTGRTPQLVGSRDTALCTRRIRAGRAVTVTGPDLVRIHAANGSTDRGEATTRCVRCPDHPLVIGPLDKPSGQAKGTQAPPHLINSSAFPGLRMRVREVDTIHCPQWNPLLTPTHNGPCVSQHASSFGSARSSYSTRVVTGGRRLLAAWTAAWTSALSLDGARLNGSLVNQYFPSPHSPCFLLGGLADFVGLDVTALSAFAGRRPPNLCEEEDRRARGRQRSKK